MAEKGMDKCIEPRTESGETPECSALVGFSGCSIPALRS